MEGDGTGAVRARARRSRRSGAQATIEFAFVAPLFLLCFLAAVDSGLWAVQNSAEVSAVEAAARDAASAGTSPLSRTAPDAHAVTNAIVGRLQQSLFATTVVAWCDPAAGSACAPAAPAASTSCSGSSCRFLSCPVTPSAVEEVFGPRVVAVCVHEVDAPRCGTAPPGMAGPYPPYCGDTPTITVRITGFIAALVPPGLGLGESGGELPTDVAATTHTLRFAP
jgi:Flp pilus assembly protein TadG